MYIEPNTTIKLIYDCPLDGSYENTLWFDTIAAQTTYFINTLGGHVLQKNTYQRVNRGVIRVAKSADSIYDCNYMAFKNDNYLNKWFYAFIDKIDYINNVTAEITYHLDLLQTWHFAYQVEQCFVEREHSTTDEIGDNIVEEGLETGEYISDDLILKLTDSTYFEDYELVIWGTISDDPPDYTDSIGYKYVTGAVSHPYMYSGLKPIRFPLTDQGITDAMTWLNGLPASKRDGILSMNVQPSIASQIHEITISKISQISRVGGPIKNNKLYTYPYNFLYVTNNSGNSANFRYEFFNSGNCYFSVYCDETPTPIVMLTPRYYKGVGENFDETLELTGFPQICFTRDSYQAWLAQNASSIGLSAIAALLGVLLAAPAGMGAAAGVAVTAAEKTMLRAGIGLTLPLVRNAISGAIQSTKPPQAQGKQGSVASVLQGVQKFGFMHKHITQEYATIIDDYFTMYGYACKKVKVPNRSSRPEWNYVKTVACKIRGSMPSDDAVAIEQIYDNGIRFWKNPGHIGNYTFDNSPVTVPDNTSVPSEG